MNAREENKTSRSRNLHLNTEVYTISSRNTVPKMPKQLLAPTSTWHAPCFVDHYGTGSTVERLATATHKVETTVGRCLLQGKTALQDMFAAISYLSPKTHHSKTDVGNHGLDRRKLMSGVQSATKDVCRFKWCHEKG